MKSAVAGTIICLAFSLGWAQPDTVHVGGYIYNDTTWTAGPTIIVASGVSVSGATLTIQPGAVIKFSIGTTSISVGGVLNAQGTVSEPIYFTSIRDDSVGAIVDTTDPPPKAGDWRSIELRDSSSILRHCEVRYGNDGVMRGVVNAVGCSPTVDSSVFAHCDHYVLLVDYQPSSPAATPPIRDNLFYECHGRGIYYRSNGNAVVEISGNTIVVGTMQNCPAIYCLQVGRGSVLSSDSVWNYRDGIQVTCDSAVVAGNSVGCDSAVGQGISGIAAGHGVISSNRVLNYQYAIVATSGCPLISGNTIAGRNTWSYPFLVRGCDPAFTANVFLDSCYRGIAVADSLGSDAMWDGLMQGDTWPYVVTHGSGFTVPAGRTLMISEGVVIKLWRAQPTVRGELELQGTATSPVYFTSFSDDSVGGDLQPGDTLPAPGDWVRIEVYNGALEFRHCVVKYAFGGFTGALAGFDCSPLIDSCFFGLFADLCG